MKHHMDLESSIAANGVQVLRLRGRLDAQTSSQLHQHCSKARDSGRRLVLNLDQVLFVSSSGIGALLALTEEFREHGGSLRIAEVSPTVKEAIELLNLANFLELYNREEDAVREAAA